MLMDLHAHSAGISRCCRIPADEVLRHALACHIDGIVLTNHYQKCYIEDGNAAAFAERYITEFYTAEEFGKQLGCKVFFGVEVTPEFAPNVHLLVYGVEPAFLREHPCVYDYTLPELYAAVKEHNGLLVQAHPFRNGATVQDTAYLDGVEVNCHPIYGKSYCDELLEIAKANGLLVTCGGDYHADTYRPQCGVFVPDTVDTMQDLCAYLLADGEKSICVQEPNEAACSTVCFQQT